MTVPPGGVPLVTFKGVDMMLVLANFVLDSLEGAILLSLVFLAEMTISILPPPP